MKMYIWILTSISENEKHFTPFVSSPSYRPCIYIYLWGLWRHIHPTWSEASSALAAALLATAALTGETAALELLGNVLGIIQSSGSESDTNAGSTMWNHLTPPGPNRAQNPRCGQRAPTRKEKHNEQKACSAVFCQRSQSHPSDSHLCVGDAPAAHLLLAL